MWSSHRFDATFRCVTSPMPGAPNASAPHRMSTHRQVAMPFTPTYTRCMLNPPVRYRLIAATVCLAGQLLLLLLAPWAHAHWAESGNGGGSVHHSHGAVVQADPLNETSATGHRDTPMATIEEAHAVHLYGPLRWTDRMGTRLRLHHADLDATPLFSTLSVLTDTETSSAATAQPPLAQVYCTCPRTSGERARIVGADLSPPSV